MRNASVTGGCHYEAARRRRANNLIKRYRLGKIAGKAGGAPVG